MSTLNWEAKGIDINKVRGGKAFCPECHEQRKNRNDRSLSVDIRQGVFHCHNCGWKGSVVQREPPKKAFVKPQPRLEKLGSAALQFLENNRGISNHTLLRFKITEANEWMPQAGKEVPTICFNYYRDDQLVNIKFRGPQKSFKMAKDAELIFYNLDAIKGEKEAVIVEGEIDCLTLHECGIYNCVSVPNGASKGSQKLEYLDNCIESFADKQRIVIFTDNDEPGRQLGEELARRLGRFRCVTVTWPENGKDANEIYLSQGKEAIQRMVREAKPLPVLGVVQANDMLDEILEIYHHGMPKGDKISIGDVDEYITWRPGDLTTITGVPSHGKSAWLSNVVIKLAVENDWRIGMFTPEKEPLATLICDMAEIMLGMTVLPKGQNGPMRMTEDQLRTAVSIIQEKFLFIKFNEIDCTVEGVLEKGQEMVARWGIKGMVIDPWNYMEHKIPKGYSETQYISEALTKIKFFKDQNSVHVFLVAHPTKQQKNGKKQYNVPDLYSISGSAHFYNKTDNGVVVYRNFESGNTEIHFQKIRHWWIGKVGSCELRYNVYTKRYTGLDHPLDWQYGKPIAKPTQAEIELPPTKYRFIGQSNGDEEYF